MNLTGIAEPLGILVGFTLTLCLLSYIIGYNVLFRLALHVFIGVASGYAAMLVIYNVLWYQLLLPLIQDPLGNPLMLVPPLILGIWLLVKASPRLAKYGSPVVALLVGVSVATVVGGAILGTIFPQALASANMFDLESATQDGVNLVAWFVEGAIILGGTIAALLYFSYGVKQREGQLSPQRSAVIEGIIAPIGQLFIAITFGALFAGVFMAALAALIERMSFIWDLVALFLS